MDLLAQLALRHTHGEFHQISRPKYRSPLEAFIEGFSLHAGTHIHQNDRPGLEHLCRYGSRPPIAFTRLKKLDDGNYLICTL